MSQPQLKRSHKTDFTNAAMVSRERSFIKPSKDPQKRRSHTMATIKAGGKPTMEIYRPPNIRSDGLPSNNNNGAIGKLNVHAKEFTMGMELQSSKSSGNLYNFDGIPLQHSKSSGSILRTGFIPIIPHHHHHHHHHQHHPLPLPLLHSTSTTQLLNAMPRMNYQYDMPSQPVFSGQNHYHNLKRSKSLGATDSQNLAIKLKNLAKEEIDLKSFPIEAQANLKIAINDPNSLSSRIMMDLVKIIMERVVESIKYSEAGAKLCISIIEKEKNQTFLESLLNICQQWYQERDKILRGIKAGDGTRFTAFMWFLTEMCGQLKRHQLKEQFTLQPDLILLNILAKCCQACITLPIKCLTETECLFFVLTSIGKDLENELPQQLEQLMDNVRDGFLVSDGSSAVRRTLLQLIELHASNWQLPGSSVLYYYPRIK